MSALKDTVRGQVPKVDGASAFRIISRMILARFGKSRFIISFVSILLPGRWGIFEIGYLRWFEPVPVVMVLLLDIRVPSYMSHNDPSNCPRDSMNPGRGRVDLVRNRSRLQDRSRHIGHILAVPYVLDVLY